VSDQIFVTPNGKPYGFTAFEILETADQDTLYASMTTADLLANFKDKKPGFFHVEKLGDRAIRCEFLALNTKEIHTVYEQGLTTKEVTFAETAQLIIMIPEKYVLVTGAEGAVKPALYHLVNCLSVECRAKKPQQEQLMNLLDTAIRIWSVKYTNIKHTELKEVMFKGALEDKFPMEGDIGQCDIGACEVSLSLGAFGMRNVRASKEGRVMIKKTKKQPVTLGLVTAVLHCMFG